MSLVLNVAVPAIFCRPYILPVSWLNIELLWSERCWFHWRDWWMCPPRSFSVSVGWMDSEVPSFHTYQFSIFRHLLREAFQSKKRRNLGNGQKIKKAPSFSWEKFKKKFGNQKSPKFQRVPKTNKIMTHFHLMRTQKHKIWSIVVLNMAKYTIISLILTDFVPIFFIFNLFRQNFRGSFRFKKIPSSKKSQVDFRGGVNTILKSPKLKKVSFPLWTQFGKLPLGKRFISAGMISVWSTINIIYSA